MRRRPHAAFSKPPPTYFRGEIARKTEIAQTGKTTDIVRKELLGRWRSVRVLIILLTFSVSMCSLSWAREKIIHSIACAPCVSTSAGYPKPPCPLSGNFRQEAEGSCWRPGHAQRFRIETDTQSVSSWERDRESLVVRDGWVVVRERACRMIKRVENSCSRKWRNECVSPPPLRVMCVMYCTQKTQHECFLSPTVCWNDSTICDAVENTLKIWVSFPPPTLLYVCAFRENRARPSLETIHKNSNSRFEIEEMRASPQCLRRGDEAVPGRWRGDSE